MSQNKLIKKHLEQGKKLTPLEALNLFGCLRLASRILELKKEGLNITKRLVTLNNKRYAEYKLEN